MPPGNVHVGIPVCPKSWHFILKRLLFLRRLCPLAGSHGHIVAPTQFFPHSGLFHPPLWLRTSLELSGMRVQPSLTPQNPHTFPSSSSALITNYHPTQKSTSLSFSPSGPKWRSQVSHSTPTSSSNKISCPLLTVSCAFQSTCLCSCCSHRL